MQNAEWTGRAGADQWDVGVAHSDMFYVFLVSLEMTISTKLSETDA